eukprot:1734817-Amphidinium_carterae.1
MSSNLSLIRWSSPLGSRSRSMKHETKTRIETFRSLAATIGVKGGNTPALSISKLRFVALHPRNFLVAKIDFGLFGFRISCCRNMIPAAHNRSAHHSEGKTMLCIVCVLCFRLVHQSSVVTSMNALERPH